MYFLSFLHSQFPFKKEQTTHTQQNKVTTLYNSLFFFCFLRLIIEYMKNNDDVVKFAGKLCVLLNLDWIDVQCIDHVKLFWKQELLFFIIILLIFLLLLLGKVLIFMNFLWFLFCGVYLFSSAYGSVTQVSFLLFLFLF